MPEEQESEELLLSDTQDPVVEGSAEVPDGVIKTPETVSKLEGKFFSRYFFILISTHKSLYSH